MANPTFQLVPLSVSASREIIGSPVDRNYRETMPGVNGAFVQANGRGPRQITLTGYMTGSGASAALSAKDLKDNIRTVQQQIGKVGTYVGTDEHSYSNASLASYTPGPVQVLAGGLSAICSVVAVIVDAEP